MGSSIRMTAREKALAACGNAGIPVNLLESGLLDSAISKELEKLVRTGLVYYNVEAQTYYTTDEGDDLYAELWGWDK